MLEYDALLMPVAPTPAFKLGEDASDPIKMYLADIMTVPASLAGLPAVFPCQLELVMKACQLAFSLLVIASRTGTC
ncbi:amidase family protein [Candidatus Minimicrobia naudis]